ncbi:hypothetical protein B2D07_13410 [Desulfococcus multivorans]|nr:uncharacterized protein Dmul_26850 [Desulfococcus multivorans]AQV01660.1 hypothetical protein B2D07_13410 [Desulfococcus multivorans]
MVICPSFLHILPVSAVLIRILYGSSYHQTQTIRVKKKVRREKRSAFAWTIRYRIAGGSEDIVDSQSVSRVGRQSILFLLLNFRFSQVGAGRIRPVPRYPATVINIES